MYVSNSIIWIWLCGSTRIQWHFPGEYLNKMNNNKCHMKANWSCQLRMSVSYMSASWWANGWCGKRSVLVFKGGALVSVPSSGSTIPHSQPSLLLTNSDQYRLRTYIDILNRQESTQGLKGWIFLSARINNAPLKS